MRRASFPFRTAMAQFEADLISWIRIWPNTFFITVILLLGEKEKIAVGRYRNRRIS